MEYAPEILDLIGEAVLVVSPAGGIVSANRAAREIMGVHDTHDDAKAWQEQFTLHRADGTPFPVDELPLTLARKGTPSDDVEIVIRRRKDGAVVHTLSRARPLPDSAGGLVVVADITEARLAQRTARTLDRLYRLTLRNLPGIAVGLFDEDLHYLMVEGAALAVVRDRNAPGGAGFVGDTLATEPEERDRLRAACRAVFRGHRSTMTLRAGGRRYEIAVEPAKDESGAITGLMVARDVTAERDRVSHLKLEAAKCTMTALFNRGYFVAKTQQTVAMGSRPALLFIDLDDFKRFNTAYGQVGGDAVLTEVARRLEAEVRSGVDTVGRIGGDEFAILMPHISAADAIRTAERIVARVAEPILLPDGETTRATVTVGIAIATGNTDPYEQLLSRANTAAALAKREGKNRARLAP